MTPPLAPPRLAVKVLRAGLPFSQQSDILGDMEELFRARAARSGLFSAHLWYWRQALSLPVRFMGESGTNLGALSLQEVRLSIRTLWREPTFTMVTVLILGLAIGANTAIYSVVDGVLLEALPYPEPDRLMTVGHTRSGPEIRRLPSATGIQDVYAQEAGSFDAIALFRSRWANLSGGDRPERILSATVTPSLFEVLRTQPVLGRAFTEEEGRPEGPDVAIIGHAVWTDLYGEDAEILGREIRLDGIPRRIVGVMEEGFGFPGGNERVWVPLSIDPSSRDFGGFNYQSIGRLKEGITPETAAMELETLFPILSERFSYLSPGYLSASGLRPDVHPFAEDMVGNVKTALWILMATVGFVLLIACANVANLFLARAEGRKKEMAVRVAIGAGKGQLAVRYLVESGVLVAGGGILGVGTAHFALEALKGMGISDLPRIAGVGIDGSVLAVTGAIMAFATLAFGAIPSLRNRRRGTAGILRDGTGGSMGNPSGQMARKVLVTSQVALALILLMASALMTESFRALRSVDPGFQGEGVLTFRVSLPVADYPRWDGAAAFHRHLLDRVQEMPGVEVAGAVTTLPLSGRTGLNPISVDSRVYDSGTLPPVIQSRAVTPEYFAALGIPVLSGRMLEEADETGRTGAVLLSQAVADAIFPGEPSLGARVAHSLPDPHDGWSTVVGIVGDVHDVSLTQEPMGILYFAIHPGEGVQKGWLAQSMSYAVKTDLPPLSLLPTIRGLLADLDSTVPLADPRLLEDMVEGSQAEMAFSMLLVGIAAGLGLLLAAVGLFGVVSYLTAQRTREIGVRVALGARASAVRQLVVRQGMGVTLTGLILGVLGALLLGRFMEALLFQVNARDPLLMVLVTTVLGGVSLLATWIPASRATRVDPVEALRTE